MARCSNSHSASVRAWRSWYTKSMTTTIKVANDVRDRLKAQAAAAHRTLGEHLAYLADVEERSARLAAMREAIAATLPEAMESYRAELDAWQRLDRD